MAIPLLLVTQGSWTAEASAPIGAKVLGVYTGTSSPADVATFERIAGTKIRWAMQFDTAASWELLASDNPWTLAAWGASGYRMVWTIPMLPSGKPSGRGKPCCGASLAMEATGAYDSYFSQFGNELVAHHQGDAVLRIGPEFNGQWDAWAAPGQIHNFIAAYRQVVTAFRSVAHSDFTFDWNPIISDVGTGDPGSYYPGNSYVDEVGFDVYDTAWKHYPARTPSGRTSRLNDTDWTGWPRLDASTTSRSPSPSGGSDGAPPTRGVRSPPQEPRREGTTATS